MSRHEHRTAHTAPSDPHAASGWDDALARWLVQRAARHAPPHLAPRLEEEWLADLAARRGALARVRFGIGCCWATRIIAHEHGTVTVPAASSASARRVMVLRAHFDPSRFSRRTCAILVLIGVHAAIIYALVTGLAQKAVAILPTVIQGSVTQDVRKRELPPPLPAPKLTAARVEVPAPVLNIAVRNDEDTIRVAPPPVHTGPPSVPPAHRVLDRVMGGPGAGFPDTDEYYPPVSRRLGEMGTAAVRVCVDPRGRLTAAPTIVQSSGNARLDAGALRLANAGSGHYRPTAEDGRPVSACYAFRIRFQLRD